MPQTVVLVGTRKGCSSSRATAIAATGSCAGPFCEGWPIYHAVHDADSGAIYAAAASEWHGAGVWRSNDLGETWELSSEGLAYGDGGHEALEDLGPDRGARAPARRRRGARHLREPRRRRDVVAAQHARGPARAARTGTTRRSSRPAISGCRRSCRTPTTPARFWAIVQGIGMFETTDNGASWTPRNRGLRADWPLETPRSATACTSS